MAATVKIDFTYLPAINFAIMQNRISFVREFIIENTTDANINHIAVTLQAEPEFGEPEVFRIDTLKARERVRITDNLFHFSPSFFNQLTEKYAGHFQLSVQSEEELLYSQIYPVDLLAFDQWPGANVLPEILASFVLPNHPSLAPIIKRASELLEEWTGNGAMDEYQSRNPNRVIKQMAAIYAAITELNISYCTVPASFEEEGQRIRLADCVVTQKLGNCLDMSMLYCSCLEAVGIHPIIIIIQGHAFAGGWLIPDTFSDKITDDPSSLSKREADGINEITLVECTCMNTGHRAAFDNAVELAAARLPRNTEFMMAIDIKRCRFSGIRPLPVKVFNGEHWVIDENSFSEQKSLQEQPQNVNPYDLAGISEDVNVTKQLLWERKLLDLSLRNNLLNIRLTKNTLQFMSTDLDQFENALSDGTEFQILSRPTDWDSPLYENNIHEEIDETSSLKELVRAELTQKRIHSYLNDNELIKTLTHIYRSSRTALEENGANTLYIALGLLEWYETPSSIKPRYAPILLLPVEIVRKSGNRGYAIHGREEDSMMNITLLEMLRQNFGITINGLEPLPVDESGVDVKLIFSIIRNCIRDQKKWNVREQAMLGIFSFNKFIMWNDIHNNSDKLIESPIVSSLISGKIEWNIDISDSDASKMEKEVTPADILLPISADSSQLEAIFDASQGKSFILHGPPGTGKSQTITNIIANALYRGKKVLFVAEKMAALSVVQNRLETLGLAPFCLELYSNKSKKSSVLNQLKNATEVVKTQSPQAFQEESERLFSLRTQINRYVEALHQKQNSGFSLYDSITYYLSTEDETIRFPQEVIQNISSSQVKQWDEAIDSLISVVQACAHPYHHPLTGIHISTYSTILKEEAEQLLDEMYAGFTRIAELDRYFQTYIARENPECFTYAQAVTLRDILQELSVIPELTPFLLKYPRLQEALEEMQEVLPHGERRDELKKSISATYQESVLDLPDAALLLQQWQTADKKWFLPKYFGHRKIKKQLSAYHKTGSPDTTTVAESLYEIIEYQKERNILEESTEEFPSLFGKYGKRNKENWLEIKQIIEHTRLLDNYILQYANGAMYAATVREKLAPYLQEGILSFRKPIQQQLDEYLSLFSQAENNIQTLYSLLGVDKNTFYGTATSPIPFSMILEQLKRWRAHTGQLKDWYQWLIVKKNTDDAGIGFFAEAFCDKNISILNVKNIFNKSLHKELIEYTIEKDENLLLFKGKLFDDTIEKFRSLSQYFEELTRKELFARLASNVPDFTREATQNSEVGILQRNIRNNARSTSIRKLFDQIPILLPRLCPCMLMSPISVSQYINSDAEKFDLLIFDEASQLPTYEAVGAISRSANVVIVGDPKQMPPTNFFAVNNVDEDNYEIEDLESILDDCLALSMPEKYLLWHYRSKHESLIAFSNSEYYGNKLLTFPSPDNIESKVSLLAIKGYYDKGKSRQNKAEAQAVIDEIGRRLNNPELRQKSIGVVTFSSVQQTLIEDMLSDYFIYHPELEALALESREPIFIKNLENVQGDERDIILFSVGYGPDKSGRVSMNFGPLNRIGGERRLNVAVSRARYEMLIFSTLRSDQIDLNRSSSVGVAGLKRFLEYAESRERTQWEQSVSGVNQEVEIEHFIAEAIREMGYQAHTQVGCSGYKIDIGVVDKSNNSSYILGILCDGESYTHSKTTRDREIVQYNTLRLLGWNILHVWTLDWWENKTSVLDSIRERIQALENGKQTEIEKVVDMTETPVSVPLPPINKISNGSGAGLPHKSLEVQPYSKAVLEEFSDPEGFFLPKNKAQIQAQLQSVLSEEAPISKTLLYKRILNAWNINRQGNRNQQHLDSILQEIPHYQSESEQKVFCWVDEEQLLSYNEFRTHADRDVSDLPAEEIANAIKGITEKEISLPVEDLFKQTTQLLGFSRSGSNLESAFNRGLQIAIERNFVKIDNGKAIHIPG